MSIKRLSDSFTIAYSIIDTVSGHEYILSELFLLKGPIRSLTMGNSRLEFLPCVNFIILQAIPI